MNKKVVLIPKVFVSEGILTDAWAVFVQALKERFGFAVVHTFEDLPPADLILLITSLRYSQTLRLDRICSLKGPKVILQICDLHKASYPKLREYATALIDRCDIHLSMSDMWFKLLWPDRIKKHVYFPYFFATQERYCSLPFQANPKLKCLLSGNIKEAYPVRKAIAQLCGGKKPHPGAKMFEALTWPKIGGAMVESSVCRDAYAKRLNEYLCCIAGTMFGSPINKHFEIMASGSLMVSDRTWDLDALGLKPNIHYLQITTLNLLKKISYALHPGHREETDRIRKAGMKFSRANHGAESRIREFRGIMGWLK